MARINEETEKAAQQSGWTYETGYDQGFYMAWRGQPNRNYFPRGTNAHNGHNKGFKAGKKAYKRGYI